MIGHPPSGEAIDLGPDSVFEITPEVVIAAFDDQVLVYHLDEDRTLTLNPAAGLILEWIENRCSRAEIHELMRRACPDSPDDVARDVDRTLRALREHGALESITEV